MNFELAFTLGTVVLILAALAFNLARAEFVLFLAIVALTLSGVLSAEEAISGFSNPGLITVGLLFVVSESLRISGNLDYLAVRYLGVGTQGGLSWLLVKLTAPVTFLSAFINNTPIVVIFTPVIKKWSQKIGIPASKFLIPLSYAAVFGGTCTLIGTSTNLLAHGLLLENGYRGFSLFELARVGVPCAIVGILYLAFVGRHLLPRRLDAQSQVEKNPKEYVIQMKIPKGSPLAGKRILEAGLRNLRKVYLIDIERQEKSIGPVSGSTVLEEEDLLVFAGVPSGIVDLQEMPGLVPAAHRMFEKEFGSMRTHFVEAVVSSNSPVLGKTVKECGFRTLYGAGVVAVHRNGERVIDKVGNIRLRAGDTLLLFANESFLDRWKDSQDFYLVSFLKDRPPVARYQSFVTLAITAGMILLAALGEAEVLPRFGLPRLSILEAVMGAVALLILAKCIERRELKQAIRWDVLFVIGFSIGLSKALQVSGAADWVASSVKQTAGSLSPTFILALIYFTVVLVTELLTNNAAVALGFPVAVATALQLGLDPRPFVVAVTVAASNGFASPLGYQTHLIVQGPGGYKFSDYVKVGLPLDLLVGLIAITAIRLHWPF
jgi:di/tricarboxylate transporter